MFYIALLSWCFKATKVCSLHFHKKMTLCKELVPRGFLGELRFASAIHQH